MTFIFQPERYLLTKQIEKNSKYIKGIVLDVGAGHYSRYQKFFKYDKYIKMDINHAEHVDVVGSVDSIPLQDESVDSVVCTQVFEHIKYPDKGASEIFRILKKGGYVLLTVPQTNELHEEPHDYFRYTKYGLNRIFNDAGFVNEVMEQRGGFFSTTAQMFIRFTTDTLNLYERKIIGKIIGKILYLIGMFSIYLDKKINSDSSNKHAIGWCCVYKKPL